MFWCREKVSGIADMQGKKIRVFNKTMSDFVKALGGSSISMAFGDVVPALQRGVVDCAVVGVPSDVGEEDIKAYVHAVDAACPPPPEELIAWCKK